MSGRDVCVRWNRGSSSLLSLLSLSLSVLSPLLSRVHPEGHQQVKPTHGADYSHLWMPRVVEDFHV